MATIAPSPGPTTDPSVLDNAVDAAIALVTAQVAAAEAALGPALEAALPAAPQATHPPDVPTVQIPLIPFTIKGVIVTPETHLFENGVPLLTPTGRARVKPGALKAKKEARKAKAAAFAAQLAPAPLPSTAPAPSAIVAAPAAIPAPQTTTPPVIKETVKSMTATVTSTWPLAAMPMTGASWRCCPKWASTSSTWC